MQQSIYYDLTEVLLSASAKRIQYYGIARTVFEIAKEAATLADNIRFVVFSFGKKAFYEIKWHLAADGTVEFDVPYDVGQRWSRSHFGDNALLSSVMKLIKTPLGFRNRRVWERHAAGLQEIRIEDGFLVSAARPKLIVDMIRALREAGSRAAVVPLLHDFMPLHHGATKRFRSFDRNFLRDNRFVIAASRLILTNSKFTEKELMHFSNGGLLPMPRAVTAVPLVHHCPEGREAPMIELPPQPYLLAVGLNLGRKNIEVVFEAMRRMAKRGHPLPTFAIAGARRKRLKRYVERDEFADIRSHLIFIQNPNQTDLVRLYRNALALVIPSRIEGWGLPAGEALWCGTPAICSTAEVLREVCGDLGLYFDPDDPDALAEIIEKLLNDQSFATELREKIASARPELRTWRIVATEVLEALKPIACG